MDSHNFVALCFCLLLIFSQIPSSSGINLKTSASSLGFDPTRVTQLSWTPRIFLYKRFLSDEECDHLITLAKGKLEKSMVVTDDDTGGTEESEVRTSTGMFVSRRQDDIVANVEARLAAWTFLPQDNGEAIQILHYENGQKYEPHFDFYYDQTALLTGGHRVATVLMYMSNVTKGGETVFPKWKGKRPQLKDDSWSECAKQGYAVKPTKGDALLFFNLHPNATTDLTSLHGSCPVIEGEKWSATRWIHVRSYGKKQFVCEDMHENCEEWAKAGECQKNPTYMIGSETDIGYCTKSCKACSS